MSFPLSAATGGMLGCENAFPLSIVADGHLCLEDAVTGGGGPDAKRGYYYDLYSTYKPEKKKKKRVEKVLEQEIVEQKARIEKGFDEVADEIQAKMMREPLAHPEEKGFEIARQRSAEVLAAKLEALKQAEGFEEMRLAAEAIELAEAQRIELQKKIQKEKKSALTNEDDLILMLMEVEKRDAIIAWITIKFYL